MKKISIIIPHFNTPDLLECLLHSIPVCDDFQVIIVDDSSTKNIGKLQQIKDEFPQHLFLENDMPNKGAGAARNVGLKHATGEWLLFADADDYFMPDCYKILSENSSADADIVCFNTTSVEIDTGRMSDRHLRTINYCTQYCKEKNQINENYLRYGWAVPWGKLIKRKLVVENKIFFSETMVANDQMFSAKTGAVAKKIAVSNDILYCITQNRGSLTKTISPSLQQVRVDILIEKYQFLKSILPKKQLNALKISVMGYLIESVRYHLPLSFLIKMILQCLRAGVPIVKRECFNLCWVAKKIPEKIRTFKEIDPYMVENDQSYTKRS